MTLKYKNGNTVSDSIGLLISILVRYPEVGTINFDPQSHELKLTFIFTGEFENSEVNSLNSIIEDSVITYHKLEKTNPRVICLEWQTCNNYTVLEIKRDVDTLSQDEISLIIGLFQEHFHQSLVADTNDGLWEEDLLVQEEMINHMLENMKNEVPDKKLIAYREEGKVLVFNK